MSEVTIQELDAKVAEYARLKDEHKALQDEADKKKKEVDNVGGWLLTFMSEHKKTSYKCEWGNVVKTARYTVSMPKDLESRQMLYDFLKQKNLFDEMITINHQTLNAFYKAENEAAMNAGDIDFTLPGVGEPSVHEYVTLRKR